MNAAANKSLHSTFLRVVAHGECLLDIAIKTLKDMLVSSFCLFALLIVFPLFHLFFDVIPSITSFVQEKSWRRDVLIEKWQARQEAQQERRKQAEREQDILKVLKDMQAPPERLRDAANYITTSSKYMEPIVNGILAHPNTPLEALMFLLRKGYIGSGEGLCHNPVLTLLLLECPDFAASIHEEAAQTLLHQADLPESVARLLTTHPNTIIAWEASTLIVLAGEIHNENWRDGLIRGVRKKIACVSDINERCSLCLIAELGLGPSWLADEVQKFGDPLTDSLLSSVLTPVPDAILQAARDRMLHDDKVTSDKDVGRWIQSAVSHSEYSRRWNSICWNLMDDAICTHRFLIEFRDGMLGLKALRRQNMRDDLYQYWCEHVVGNMIHGYGSSLINYCILSEIPELSEKHDRNMLRNRDFLLRFAVAGKMNPNRRGDRQFLRHLARDPNRYVRAAARERLGFRVLSL